MVCVSGKSGIIVGNKLIENWSPSLSAELVPLGFKKAVRRGEDLILGFRFHSSILTRLHWISPPCAVAGNLWTKFSNMRSSVIRHFIV